MSVAALTPDPPPITSPQATPHLAPTDSNLTFPDTCIQVNQPPASNH